jgi:hypothetical protein
MHDKLGYLWHPWERFEMHIFSRDVWRKDWVRKLILNNWIVRGPYRIHWLRIRFMTWFSEWGNESCSSVQTWNILVIWATNNSSGQTVRHAVRENKLGIRNNAWVYRNKFSGKVRHSVIYSMSKKIPTLRVARYTSVDFSPSDVIVPNYWICPSPISCGPIKSTIEKVTPTGQTGYVEITHWTF